MELTFVYHCAERKRSSVVGEKGQAWRELIFQILVLKTFVIIADADNDDATDGHGVSVVDGSECVKRQVDGRVRKVHIDMEHGR